MLRYWIHLLQEKRLYCSTCNAITSHRILAREPFSIHAEIPPEIPLVCQCKICESFVIAFSHEIFFGTKNAKAEYAKLLSQNRLAPGDWVYVDGKQRPSLVDAVYKTQTEEIIDVEYDGQKEKLKRSILTQFNEKAPFGFRLLPAQVGETLLGDPIYHVLRKMIGVAIGSVFDKDVKKLVVQLENGKIVFITLPDEFQPLPDSILLRRLTERVQQRFPNLGNSIRLNVVQNVVYVYGSVSNLPDKEAIARFVKMQPNFRGVVDMLSVYCVGSPVSDEEISREAFRILENEKSPFFCNEVHVKENVLYINAYYFADAHLEKIKSDLHHILGLRDLKLELEEVPLPPPTMRKRAEILLATLKAKYTDCNFQVIPLSEGILVEGSVKNIWQKGAVNIFILQNSKGLKINTRLRVDA